MLLMVKLEAPDTKVAPLKDWMFEVLALPVTFKVPPPIARLLLLAMMLLAGAAALAKSSVSVPVLMVVAPV